MEEIISCEDMAFSYSHENEEKDKRIPVFEGLNLTVQKGDFVAVLGHNGSGKSTLAKHFNAILLPQGGTCTVVGADTRDEDKLLLIRSHVGMVFQNPDNQIVATVVEEDVAFALENLGVPPDEIRERVDDALELVGMSDLKLRAPHQLSGGQKQRVAIAGIIAMRPQCIVLDEPTAMLDPRGRREVMETITALNKYFGVTVVLITHFMDEAAACKRVVVMSGGDIILDDAPKRVFSNVEKLKSVGLSVPQATELIFELKKAGYDLPLDVITARDCIEKLIGILEEQGVS